MAIKIAVIGAGISGLTCAHELGKAGFKVKVFEKNDHVGGRMVGRKNGDFVFDIGADHLSNVYLEMKKYCKEFGIDWKKMEFEKYGIIRDGEIKDLGKTLSWISRIKLATKFFFLKKSEKNFFNLSTYAEEDTENAYEYTKKKFGEEAANYMIDPFTSTYQFHRANEISKSAMIGIMESIKTNGDKWKLHRTPGGMSTLPEAFAEKLNIELKAEVKKIKQNQSELTEVEYTKEGKNHTEEFDVVVIASTANITKEILTNQTSKQKELLEQTEYASSISIAFKVNKKLLNQPFSIVWVPYVESKKITGFVNETYKAEDTIKGDFSTINTWLHQDFADELMNKSDEEIFTIVKKEIVRILPWIETEEQLERYDLEKWPQAMPKFKKGHIKLTKKFLEKGQGENNIFLCGDYLNSPWTEGALQCGKRVAMEIISKI